MENNLYSTELEVGVLGAILSHPSAFRDVETIIAVETFYEIKHKMIYASMLSLKSQNTAIDLLTLTTEMRRNGNLKEVGGAEYIAKLTNEVGFGSNYLKYAAILVEMQGRREIIEGCKKAIYEAEAGADTFEIQDKLVGMVATFNQQISGGATYVHIKDLLHDIDLEYQEKAKTGIIPGVKIGFADFDRETGGLQGGELIIIAARPGMGKTAFALQLATNAAKNNVPTLFKSLEMPKNQLGYRIQANEAKVPLSGIKNANLSERHFEAKINNTGKLAKSPLLIDDNANLNVNQVCAQARALYLKKGIRLLIIDYLQLIPGESKKNSNREQDISHISRSLKLLAKELNIPIIALAQLSRAVEGRGDKRPMLSDLRESGAIEQDADMVCFLYRPEYYMNDDQKAGNRGNDGFTEIIIAKHRNGALTTIESTFEAPIQYFKPKNENTALTANRDFDGPPKILEDAGF